MKQSMSKLVILFSACIALIGVACIWAWQHELYKKETLYLRSRPERSKRLSAIMSHAVEVESQLKRVDEDLAKASAILPQDGLHKEEFVHFVTDVCSRHFVRCKLLCAVVTAKEFFSQADLQIEISGATNAIQASLDEIAGSERLVDWREVCYLGMNQAGSAVNLSVRLRIFSCASFSTPESMGHASALPKTYIWLPPYSVWIRKARRKVVDTQKLLMENPDAENKLQIIVEFRRKRQELEIIQNILAELQRRQHSLDELISDISICSAETNNK